MIPLGVRIAAFLSVIMVAATSASAEQKKKGAPPQSRQSSVMWPFVELTRHFIQIGLRVHRQVSALRKALS
jgi:hypothetical protein